MKVIMTACRPEFDSLQNANRNADMCEIIDRRIGVSAVPVRGVWKGTSEPSYMFAGVVSEDIGFLHDLANEYEQDAILIVKDDKRCTLFNNDGSTLDIGDWQKVPREIAVQFDGYSVIGGDYFVAATHADVADKKRRLLATQAAVIAANEYATRIAAAGV